MPRPLRICVFCAAAEGKRPEFARAAQSLGHAIGVRGCSLIYGGGRAGLMGHVADAALAAGAQVTGVITRQLESRELGHTGITQLHVVETMHERKMMMANLADAFIALPGGIGTLDELVEILCWAQLRLHDKPVGLVNTAGFYDPFWTLIEAFDKEGFLRLDYRREVSMHNDPAALLDALMQARSVVRDQSRMP